MKSLICLGCPPDWYVAHGLVYIKLYQIYDLGHEKCFFNNGKGVQTRLCSILMQSRMQKHGRKYFAPPLRGQKVKIQLSQNMVMLHINLKRITHAATWQQIFCPQIPHRAPCKHIFSPYTHPQPVVWI